MSVREPVFMVRRLIELAGTERELLIAESWEEALPVRDEIDELFVQLQALTDKTGGPLPASLRNDLVRLHAMQSENARLMEILKRKARSAMGEMAKVSQISGYAPLGKSHKPSPRYLDESA